MDKLHVQVGSGPSPRSRYFALALLLIILLSLLASGLIGLWRFSRTLDVYEEALRNHDAQSDQIARMQTLRRERSMMLWKMSLAEDQFQRDDIYQIFLALGSQYLAERERLRSGNLDKTEQRLLDQLDDATQISSKMHNTAATALIESTHALPEGFLVNQVLPAQESSTNLLTALIAHQKEKSRIAQQIAAEENRKTLFVVLGFMTGALILGALISVVTMSRYRAMITDIQRASTLLDQANHELEQRVADRTEELEKANRQLLALSVTDGLTGIANRRHFDQVLNNEWARASRNKQPLGLLLLDVDHFKKYNDHYGHQAGDETLKQVARVLANHVRRPSDLAARYGGEEFVVILADTSPVSVQEIAESVRTDIEALAIPHEQSSAGRVTTSIGIATMTTDCCIDNPEQLLNMADGALYRAKASGRNRVATAI